MMTKRTTNLRITFFCLIVLLLTIGTQIAGASNTSRRAPWDNNDTGERSGKTEATPGAQPWMAALVSSEDSNAYDGQFCGGSLIARDWVLTAAHCLEGGTNASEVDVVIGRHQLSSNDGERIRAAQIILHPQYFDDHDIALIRLSRPATVGSVIMPITSETIHLDDAGVMGRITGWGILPETDQSPDKLHGVDVPMIDDTVCQNAYGGGQVGRYEICAGDPQRGTDACYGDSGGPLIVPNANRTGFLQAGVVSWGDGCGLTYGVYTRVSEYESWINHHLHGGPAPAPLPEDGGQTNDDWDDNGDWEDDASAENNTQLPDALPFGLELVDSGDDGYELFAIYESSTDWASISSYDDNYTNLDEYLNKMGESTSGSDIIYVDGTKLFIEDLGDGDIGAAMVIDGNLIFVDTSLSLTQLRTLVYTFLNA